MWLLKPTQRDAFITNIAIQASSYISDMEDPADRFIITAVLWAGCMGGTRAIRDKKVLDVIPADNGQKIIEGHISDAERLAENNKIEALTASDCLYRHGVEVSPILRKTIRGQKIFYNGIPTNSTLMEFIKPFLD